MRAEQLGSTYNADVSVQRATEQHLAAIADMRAAAAFEEAVFDRLAPTKKKRFANNELERLQRMQGMRGNSSSMTLVATVDNTAVGSVDVSLAKNDVILEAGCAVDAEDTYYYVDNVVVIEGWRGQGIGASLMEAVEQAVSGVLLVRVELNNTEAVGLYSKMGYRGDYEGCTGGSTVGVMAVLSKRP